MIADPVFYALAIPAVVLMGLAKGGFSGVGAVSMPLLALAVSPVQAAAILLPILIVQDAVSVWAFRRDWDRRILVIMIPGAAVGILGGYLLAAQVSAAAVLGVLGAISIVFAVHRLWLMRGGRVQAPASSSVVVGAAFGAVSGFTSQIAHAGGPPFQMWVLPRGLPPKTLVGTTAIFFAIINWLKVPAYAALGQFTPQNLAAVAALLPVAIASTFAGVWLVKRVQAERFYVLIYGLMIPVGAHLIWKAFAT
ncbi:sulfite exporter TauE/SafE family protein [Phenylobacterium kunshanense]|uniref:Probable membrane transporter protein n=1 Tax=Phenylobacterium kunshanense TaxID=1445034 RepID=A0A328BGD3_9CAUL|nr:sulfite exporter TauE/SafE family protein [Phenylobacterium kunshanense]RAK64956.1 sulfite exporter TauE/SafE family protein [Phenylobacterium kunshanense]